MLRHLTTPRHGVFNRPSGGSAARFRMNFNACLKLQNVSGNSGYSTKTFIHFQPCSKTAGAP
jgi:hypothetical protein